MKLRGSIDIEHTLAKKALKSFGNCCMKKIISMPWCFNRKSGCTASKSQLESHLLKRLAGSCGCQPFRTDVSRPKSASIK